MESVIRHPYDERGRSPALQRYQLGREMMARGSHAEALPVLMESARESPHFKTFEVLGECLVALGRPAEAVPWLAAATTLNRNSRSPTLLAETWLVLGRIHAARSALDLALERNPRHRRALRLAKELADHPDLRE